MDNVSERWGTGSILVVDDDLSACQTLSQLLEREGYEVRCAPSGQTALLFAREEPPELVLLDIRLPDVDGFEVCRRFKEDAGTRAVPVIFLSALGEAEDKVKGFAAGGADYITKPFHAEEVLARVRTHVALRRMQSDLERLVEERTEALQAANAQLAQHVEVLNRSEEQMRQRLKFEALLTDLSGRFVNLPAEQVGTEIQRAQQSIVEALGLDRSSLWQISEREPDLVRLASFYEAGRTVLERADGKLLSSSDWIHQSSDAPPLILGMEGEAFFPWITRQVRRGETICLSTMDDLPAEAAYDKEVLRRFDTKSNVSVPLRMGGAVIGVLTFAMVREERAWSGELVKQFAQIGEVFANALARSRADRALRDSEARLSLAASSAGALLWEIDPHTGHVWTTETGREIHGIAPGELLTLERILSKIHPEDREQARRALEEALQSDRTMRIEYRVVLADGSVRWIAFQGRLQSSAVGEPGRLLGVSLDITAHKRKDEQLEARLREIEDLKQQLEQENVHLRAEVKHLFVHGEIVGQSDAMRRVLAQVEQVAPTDSTVLIFGETGAGKELIAQAIHNLSRRKGRALVTVNCASLPPSLIESELFGREKGAYTGAMTMMRGRFEVADGSTLFLDEIGDLPLEAQAKLLRVLEEGRFERLGSTRTLSVDVRIIAASNRDLAQDAEAGRFRRDLFYRLHVFPIAIPPLRERLEDIPLLVWAFVREFEKKMGKRIESIPGRTIEAFQRHPWPGNVRELRNIIERAMILCQGKTLEVPLATPTRAEFVETQALEDVERRHILDVLEKTRWRLTGQGGAAERLGLKRTTLQSRMKKLGIKRPAS